MSGVQTVHGEPGSIVVSGYSPQEATLKDGTTVTGSNGRRLSLGYRLIRVQLRPC